MQHSISAGGSNSLSCLPGFFRKPSPEEPNNEGFGQSECREGSRPRAQQQSKPPTWELERMLAWYRSRDLEKVTLATHWFVSIDIQKQLSDLIEDLRNGNLEEVENAKKALASFSEIGVKRVVALLEDPELHRIAVEILSEMDEYVFPHLLRWIERTDSYNVRIGIYRALTGHLRDPRAKRALADGLRSSDHLEAAFVCQALLEVGPKGRRIIEVVFPEVQSQVA